jgi:hypothetical protein
MASPKDKEQKMKRMLDAWRSLAPGKSFGGMTLAQFEAIVQPALDARQQLSDIEDQRTKAITIRDEADDVFAEKAILVVNGVRADPTEGVNGALYQAFGYTPTRARDSGLTRKSKKTGTK